MSNVQNKLQLFESDGSNITLKESILSEVQSIKVRGNTVKSLTARTYSTLCLDDKTRESVEPINSSEDSISGFSVSTTVDTTGGWMYVVVGTDIESMLEPSTSYDIYLEIESTYSGSTEVMLSSGNWAYLPTDVATVNFTEGKEIYKVTLTTKEDILTNQDETMAHCSFNNRQLSTGDEVHVKLVDITKSGQRSNGLLSTTLVLTHNGTQYPVKEEIDGQVILRGVGDVYDEWERFSDGTSKLTTRLWSKVMTDTAIDKIVLRNMGDGSTTISFNIEDDVYPIKMKSNASLLCNMFDIDTPSQNGIEGCGVSNTANEIFVEISRGKLESNDIAGVKKYLKSLYTAGTPLEFVYELKTPIVTTLPASRTPRIFTTMGTNTIGVVSAVKPRYISVSGYNSAEDVTDCKVYEDVDGKITLDDKVLPYATLRSLEIKGQTVKNYLKNQYVSEIDYSKNTSVRYISLSKDQDIVFKSGFEYCIVIDVESVDFGSAADKNLYIQTIKLDDQANKYSTLGTPTVGINKFKFVQQFDYRINGSGIYIQQASFEAGYKIKIKSVAIIEFAQSTFVNGTLAVGLNSTQAILSNNGLKYSFYANAEDNASGKVIELGGVGDVRDTLEILEDGSGSYVKNTNVYIPSQNDNFVIANTTEAMISFEVVKSDVKLSANGILCNVMPTEDSASVYLANKRGCATSPSKACIRICLNKSELTAQDVAGLKTYLINMGVAFRYQLANPIITHIPKELIPTFLLENGVNEIQLKSPVAPTSLKATVQTFKELDIPKVRVYQDNVEVMITKLGTHVDATKQVYNELQATEQKVSLLEKSTDTKVENHISDISNPHHVTKTQVGLGNVPNYGIASTAEAEQGLSNEKFMTPKLVKEAIRALGGEGSSGTPVFTTNFATYKFTCGSAPTSTFSIPNFTGKLLTGILFDNMTLVEGEDYVVATDGKVKLNFELQPQTSEKHAEFVVCLLFNTGYHYNELSGIPSTFPPSSHTHSKSEIRDFPTSLPASDVYPWAKQPTKPSYSASEVGAIPTSASCNKNWNWAGQGGQPDWLWGGNDGTNMYVYNPSNFSVNNSRLLRESAGGGHFLMADRYDSWSTRLYMTYGDMSVKSNSVHVAYADNSGNANTLKNRDLCAEVDSLKSTVVSGKQSVANAINGKLGTSLSNQTSFADMAHYINQLFGITSKSLVDLFNVSGSYKYQYNNGLPVTKTCQHIFFSSQGNKGTIVWRPNTPTTALVISDELRRGFGLTAYVKQLGTEEIRTVVEASGHFHSYIFPTPISITLISCDSSGIVGFN